MSRITHLLLDFDETLTISDTITALASTAYHLRPSHLPPLPPWQHFVDAYTRDYTAHTRLHPKSSRKTKAQEFAFLDSLLPVESASIRRIEAAGVFKGLRSGDVEKAGESVRLREGAGRVFEAAKKRGVRTTVLSVNWSRAWIRGALEKAAPGGLEVVSNDLCTDESGVATGMLSRPVGGDVGIWTAGHKERCMRSCCCDEQDGVTVYVGDSCTDLMCLLLADVGVVVGDKLDEVCGRIGVAVVEGLDRADEKQAGQVLYKVSDLETLGRWIETHSE
ncbi:HAD-like domain-containing protein [Sphaerosporella brunnea]|uniref:HAD-like domain-containing protein n=1 Tax=Sphaerosporella brunnea TaxID=1250544 RepID=A0A5J5ERX3_9PEZI|nr:HAD-like domain-containing protein [Sphaerosporella brunnea]